MSTKARKTVLAVSFALVAILASAIPVAAQSSHYSLQMENKTGYDLYKVYFSSVSSGEWGEDQLGPQRIFHDESTFTLTGILPGRYDLMFVDKGGASCVVRNVPIYSNRYLGVSLGWLVDNCEA